MQEKGWTSLISLFRPRRKKEPEGAYRARRRQAETHGLGIVAGMAVPAIAFLMMFAWMLPIANEFKFLISLSAIGVAIMATSRALRDLSSQEADGQETSADPGERDVLHESLSARFASFFDGMRLGRMLGAAFFIFVMFLVFRYLLL